MTTPPQGSSYVEVRALDVNGNLTPARSSRSASTAPLRRRTPVTPAEGATFVQNEQVAASFSWSDAGGSDVDTCAGTVQDGADIDTATVGTKTFAVTATDAAGNTSTVTRSYTVVDVTPPGITIDSPAVDASFDRHQDVPDDYTCSDEAGGSGLATCEGTVPDGVAVPTADIGDHDFTVNTSDVAGNVASLTRTYTVLDVTAPTVTLATPADGAVFAHKEEVLADFRCADEDGGSGVAEGYCEGTVDAGTAIDTGTLGAHAFTVTATDRAGNETIVTSTYEVVD